MRIAYRILIMLFLSGGASAFAAEVIPPKCEGGGDLTKSFNPGEFSGRFLKVVSDDSRGQPIEYIFKSDDSSCVHIKESDHTKKSLARLAYLLGYPVRLRLGENGVITGITF
jgi:hypothetical protein